ncbi:hypothetical protein ISF12_10415 [Pseudomonas aeruginosa]|nr:hypothetical protein [Pseudomonas aeruginosa]
MSQIPEGELRSKASVHQHAEGNGSAGHFCAISASWHYGMVDAAGLGAFPSKADALSWIGAKIATLRAEGNALAQLYEGMLSDGVKEPIIIGTTLANSAIWNGLHLVAIAMARGEPAPAIIGVPHHLAGLATAEAKHLPPMLVHAAGMGNDVLLLALDEIKRQRPDLAEPLHKQFAGVAYFYDDAPGRLGELARMAIRLSEGADAIKAITHKYGGDLAGLQLANEAGQAALFSPDASEPGRYRASFFDTRGFYGHVTRDSYPVLLKEVFGDGYQIEAPGTFERYSLLPSFERGNAVASVVQSVNVETMSWARAREHLDQIINHYALPASGKKSPAPSM